MTKPTIHRNGTARQDLLEQVLDARSALRLANNAMQNAYPNGRDYYPQGSAAINSAVAEHKARLDKLAAIDAELIELADHIADSEGPR